MISQVSRNSFSTPSAATPAAAAAAAAEVPAAGAGTTANQLWSRPSRSRAKLSQKPAKVPKMPATAFWLRLAAQTAAMIRPREFAARTTGTTPPRDVVGR